MQTTDDRHRDERLDSPEFDEFWQGYLSGLVFTGHKEGTEEDPYLEPIWDSLDGEDWEEFEEEIEKELDKDTLQELKTDCEDFFLAAFSLVSPDFYRAGSDFHLTRNRHGAGFWDGYWKAGKQLTELSHPYGTCELIQAGDGSFYVHN